MKILSIANDKKITDITSVSFLRQKKYFKDTEVDILIISAGEKREIAEGNINVYSAGGNNKFLILLESIFVLMKLCRKNKYSFVLTQDVMFTGLLGWFVKIYQKTSLITQLHGDYLDNPLWIRQRRLNILINFFGKIILKKSTAIRVVSERIKKQIVKDYKIDPSIVGSLPIGTDLTDFYYDQTIERDQVMLFVGRLIEEKSPLVFCEVAANILKKFNQAKAVIMGDGNLKPVMEKIFKDNGLSDRAIFTGHIPAKEMAAWYRRSYCLVHTAAWEGWGMPMIEACACGCVVVTTDTGCAGEAIKDNMNGFVCPIDDVDSMTKATFKLFNDSETRKRLSKASIEEAKNWSIEILAQKTKDFYYKYAEKI